MQTLFSQCNIAYDLVRCKQIENNATDMKQSTLRYQKKTHWQLLTKSFDRTIYTFFLSNKKAKKQKQKKTSELVSLFHLTSFFKNK